MPEDKKESGIVDTFLNYESAIKRFLGRILYRPEDVDEIAQETFLKAYSAKHKKPGNNPGFHALIDTKMLGLT